MKNGLASFLVFVLAAGCSRQTQVAATPTPSQSPTVISTLISTASALPGLPSTPTAGLWLPYDPNPSNAGCGDFVASLPIQGTQAYSQEQIFKQLFEAYLTHFRSPGLGGICRLKDYKVESVLVDQKIAFLAAEQHLDRVAWVEFSVQVSSEPTDWVAGNGELAAAGWVSHKALIVGYARTSTEYILKIIGTGP
jgi:hypothetical protein